MNYLASLLYRMAKWLDPNVDSASPRPVFSNGAVGVRLEGGSRGDLNACDFTSPPTKPRSQSAPPPTKPR